MGRWPAPWPKSAYLIGIAGSAMSGLAALLQESGVRVSGSDAAIYPPASEVLAESGIDVRTPYDAANLPGDCELVIVGNAISRGHPELEAALASEVPLASMAEVIERLLVPGRRVSAVAGTHGKTTSASLLAHLHHAAGRDPSFLIGGRPGNFARGERLGRGEDLVLEADEYDTAFFDKGPKFLHYWPKVAILGPVEFDHADIYRDRVAVEFAFSLLVRLVPSTGTLVVHGDDECARRLASEARCRVVETGSAPTAELRIVEREDDESGQGFALARGGRISARVRLALPGLHNAQNAAAALAAAEAAGLPLDQAIPLVAGFLPPRRRLDVRARGGRGVLYDDFAHHPTAVRHTLETLRTQVPRGGRLIACLEPRSNTMVRSFVRKPLEDALALADMVFVGEVDRPERFEDDERLDVHALVQSLVERGVEAAGPVSTERIIFALDGKTRAEDRIVVMSNGAFGGLPARLARALGGGDA
jgi:UDP-N-acetylmuramate: L-alanyl-gamma-D-glutamyl-meso-diaminopimelate ligase